MTHFTVKHRALDGTETYHTAEHIRVVQGKGRFEDGIFLDTETPATAEDPRCAKHIILFSTAEDSIAPGENSARGGEVWIMNANGATVGTYRL